MRWYVYLAHYPLSWIVFSSIIRNLLLTTCNRLTTVHNPSSSPHLHPTTITVHFTPALCCHALNGLTRHGPTVSQSLNALTTPILPKSYNANKPPQTMRRSTTTWNPSPKPTSSPAAAAPAARRSTGRKCATRPPTRWKMTKMTTRTIGAALMMTTRCATKRPQVAMKAQALNDKSDCALEDRRLGGMGGSLSVVSSEHVLLLLPFFLKLCLGCLVPFF